MSPRVCLFTDSLYPSGVGEHMLTLGAELRREYRVAFVCPPSPSGIRLLERAQQLGLDTASLTVRGDPAARQYLRDWLHSRRIDVFHGHAGSNREGYEGIQAAREAGVPAVVRTEHLPQELTEPAERRAYDRLQQTVDRIVCVSEGVRATFQQAGVPARRLRVVHNGIDPGSPVIPDRAGVRALLGLPGDALIVLTVARFYPQKGHRYLAAAAPMVIQRVPHAHFVWVGEGADEGVLRRQLTALGVERQVHFVGQREDVRSLLAAADVFTLCSLYEGLPLVALEAMATGLPIVGTRVCGTSEAVDDGLTGRLVEVGDELALAAALIELLGWPDLRARWGAAGRQRFAERFTAAHMAAATSAVYDEVLRESAVHDGAPEGPLVGSAAQSAMSPAAAREARSGSAANHSGSPRGR